MFTFWPGYPALSRYGHWTYLGIALLFAAALDAFLIANFYWTAAMTPMQRNGLLALLFVLWIVLSTASSVRRKAFEATTATERDDRTYRDAVVHYLRGNWFEAESLIVPRLKKNPHDVELLLLQATLYRHTGRYEEASTVLDRLDRLDGADFWRLEIRAERRLVEQGRLQPPPGPFHNDEIAV